MSPAVAKAQAALDAHKAKRPDHLKALHPDAPKALRDEFHTWMDDNDILVANLDAAKVAASKCITVTPAEQPKQFQGRTHEDHVACGKLGGRPRTSNSKDAIRLRARRQKLREAANG